MVPLGKNTLCLSLETFEVVSLKCAFTKSDWVRIFDFLWNSWAKGFLILLKLLMWGCSTETGTNRIHYWEMKPMTSVTLWQSKEGWIHVKLKNTLFLYFFKGGKIKTKKQERQISFLQFCKCTLFLLDLSLLVCLFVCFLCVCSKCTCYGSLLWELLVGLWLPSGGDAQYSGLITSLN